MPGMKRKTENDSPPAKNTRSQNHNNRGRPPNKNKSMKNTPPETSQANDDCIAESGGSSGYVGTANIARMPTTMNMPDNETTARGYLGNDHAENCFFDFVGQFSNNPLTPVKADHDGIKQHLDGNATDKKFSTNTSAEIVGANCVRRNTLAVQKHRAG